MGTINDRRRPGSTPHLCDCGESFRSAELYKKHKKRCRAELW